MPFHITWSPKLFRLRLPSPAADGIEGPFLKVKRNNGGNVLNNMDATNTVFDLITYIDSEGTHEGMVDMPFEYERQYPYESGTPFAPMKLTLIVKNGEVRVLFPTPEVDTGTEEPNRFRQSDRYVSAWSTDLGSGYRGGKIGFFTSKHRATFKNLKITDLSKSATPVQAFCGGSPDSTCDESKGVCIAVPLGDICPDPVNPIYHDTQSMSTFELVDEEMLSSACECVTVIMIRRGTFAFVDAAGRLRATVIFDSVPTPGEVRYVVKLVTYFLSAWRFRFAGRQYDHGL